MTNIFLPSFLPYTHIFLSSKIYCIFGSTTVQRQIYPSHKNKLIHCCWFHPWRQQNINVGRNARSKLVNFFKSLITLTPHPIPFSISIHSFIHFFPTFLCHLYSTHCGLKTMKKNWEKGRASEKVKREKRKNFAYIFQCILAAEICLLLFIFFTDRLDEVMKSQKSCFGNKLCLDWNINLESIISPLKFKEQGRI